MILMIFMDSLNVNIIFMFFLWTLLYLFLFILNYWVIFNRWIKLQLWSNFWIVVHNFYFILIFLFSSCEWLTTIQWVLLWLLILRSGIYFWGKNFILIRGILVINYVLWRSSLRFTVLNMRILKYSWVLLGWEIFLKIEFFNIMVICI